MPIKTLSSREFQQNASRAQKAARNGPVVITSRGKPAHVLMSFEEYRRISSKREKIVDLLALPGAEKIAIEFPRHRDLARPADLS